MNCECWVDHSENGPTSVVIVYCPLHKAAPIMAEALTTAHDTLSNIVTVTTVIGTGAWPEPTPVRSLALIKAALTAAGVKP